MLRRAKPSNIKSRLASDSAAVSRRSSLECMPKLVETNLVKQDNPGSSYKLDTRRTNCGNQGVLARMAGGVMKRPAARVKYNHKAQLSEVSLAQQELKLWATERAEEQETGEKGKIADYFKRTADFRIDLRGKKLKKERPKMEEAKSMPRVSKGNE